MFLCIPHRFYYAFMGAVGFFLVNGYREVFNLSISHATKETAKTKLSNSTEFLKCTTTNSSQDLQDQFPASSTLIFSAIFFAGSNLGSILGSVSASRIPADKVMCISLGAQALLFLGIPEVCREAQDILVAIVRLLCGLCDGAYQPSLIFLVGSWSFPWEKSRVMAVSLIGRTMGYVCSSLITSLTMCFISWDSGFFLFGAMGVSWALQWGLTSKAVPQDCPKLLDHEKRGYSDTHMGVRSGCKDVAKNVPYKAILTSKAVWAIWFGRISSSWTTASLTALQPLFFKDAFDFSVSDFGLIVCIQPFAKVIMLWCGAYVSHKLAEKKYLSVTNVRKLMQLLGGSLECVSLMCVVYSVNWKVTYICFLLTSAATGLTENGHRCNQVDLSLHFSNIVSGITMTGMIGAALNSFFSFTVQGHETSHLGWQTIFLANSMMSLVAAIFYLMTASGDLQPWDRMPTSQEIPSPSIKYTEGEKSKLIQ